MKSKHQCVKNEHEDATEDSNGGCHNIDCFSTHTGCRSVIIMLVD